MRSLLITATLLALASAAPALAQSYAHATSQYDDRDDSRDPQESRHDERQDNRYDDRQGSRHDRGQAYDGRGAAPGGGYGYGYRDNGQGAYGDQDAYQQDRYRPASRRHHRRARASAVSRYTAAGRPVYYNDGMIRTGRDYPAGTVGLNGY
ncbi:MAG: hypothetical protein Q8K11_14745 [Phenylobacterium sp.]|uniref:hypothetical protein n=1 Tax=Phenylobacterium sp. TaxID=1871053 RepID=UPI002730B6B1|nr:hypothetical protein [Phenylobacterium sp.]MDP2011427.1 hypothetical protein [Phenylobacterium sp.]